MNKVAGANYICSSIFVLLLVPNKFYFIIGLLLLARAIWIDWIVSG